MLASSGHIGLCVLLAQAIPLAAVASRNAPLNLINTHLPGTYENINVYKLLDYQHQNLSAVCPAKLQVSPTNTSAQFAFALKDRDGDPTARACYVQPQASVVLAVLNTTGETSHSTHHTTETISLQQLEDHFPLFTGGFVNSTLKCPILNTESPAAVVEARDDGYIFSVVNHYNLSRTPLGLEVANVETQALKPIRNSYTISLKTKTGSPQYDCDYMEPAILTQLRDAVAEVRSRPQSETPRPSATPTRTPDPSTSSSCFPAEAAVQLHDGSLLPMHELRVGQSVLDSSGTFSKILMFTHADHTVVSKFIVIRTAKAHIALSPGHYLYVNDHLKTASEVSRGDAVTVVPRAPFKEASADRVTHVGAQFMRGLYNPQTSSGNIVVFFAADGVLTSTYTTAVDLSLAHHLLAPLRWLHLVANLTIPVLSVPFRQGSVNWCQIMQQVVESKP